MSSTTTLKRRDFVLIYSFFFYLMSKCQMRNFFMSIYCEMKGRVLSLSLATEPMKYEPSPSKRGGYATAHDHSFA